MTAAASIAASLDRARSARSSGDFRTGLEAAEAALREDARNLEALILKGDALAGLGDTRSAASFHGMALALAARAPPPPALVPELRRVRQTQAENARRFEGRAAGRAESARFRSGNLAPPGSWFRGGADVRQWEEGRAWGFDDTIEHEAWNDSGQDRTILIFDVWKPELSEEERRLVCALFEAIDAAGGSTPKLGI